MALALVLLTGCTAKQQPQPAPQTVQPEKNFYVPDSPAEIRNNGTVKLYKPDFSISQLLSNNSQLLLVTQEDLDSADSIQEESIEMKPMVLPADTVLYTVNNGFASYNRESGVVSFLDENMAQTETVQIPATGADPLISPDGKQVYYLQDGNICALDTELDVIRIVRQQPAVQELTGCYFDGDVLSCTAVDSAGKHTTIFFSSQMGETLSQLQKSLLLATAGDTYVAVHMDGTVRQVIFGTRYGQQQNLELSQSAQIIPVPELNGVITAQSTEIGTDLCFYDLETGMLTGCIELTGVGTPDAVLADKEANVLWFTATDAEGSDCLLCWEIINQPAQDALSCITPVYTENAPDLAGLKVCQNRVDTLNNQHGVAIRIHNNAVNGFGGYSQKAEYQTLAINGCLDKVESVLLKFPENFLYRSVETWIRICIVREITDPFGENQTSALIWYSGNAYIMLTPDAEVEKELLQAIGYVIDSRVLGNSPAYDYWDEQNPADFVYAADSNNDMYLSGDSRSFVSKAGMASSTEDRCEFFVAAMLSDGEEIFQSESMQNKLRHICLAIRDAYRLEKKTQVYTWEQYLNEPVAYQKT